MNTDRRLRARTVYLTRWICLDVESNLRRVSEESRRAADAGADLCVFPESFLHGYTRTVDARRARDLFALVSLSQPGTTFAFGSFSEDRRNRMTVWRAGSELASYDKVHLFEPNDEHRIWEPGDRYVAVDVGDWTLGLVNCNDIRFPEQSRALRLEARCDALLAIAWWPWRRDHVWSALLRARAIENAVFVIGCALAGSEYPGENFSGAGNHVFDPLGEELRTADDRLYTLDPAQSAAVIVDPLQTFRDVRTVTLAGP